MAANWQDAIARAERHAPFLARQLARFPAIAALLRAGEAEAALRAAHAAGAGAPDTAIALRRERSALALALGIADLAAAFPLGRVMEELSAFADQALDRAIAAVIAKRAPNAAAQGFTALALGKHGSRELNYSSDIDPILLYDPVTLPRRERDAPADAAQRYARDIVQLLSANTAEGYVFRVDLRLRPQSEVTPLALPFDAALSHYEGSALTWERAAFIRARAAAGDLRRGEDFLRAIDSFVWRRSLDFGTIDEVRRLTRRIRDRQSGPVTPAPGYDVKLGRGGIREIEFFVQTHQMIHGGRNPSLRVGNTLDALVSLAEATIISTDTARRLSASYEALRTVEHRLQMVDDRQTHTLPEGPALDNVARLGGWSDGAAFLAHLRDICAPVAECYDALLAEGQEEHARPAPADPHGIAGAVAGWNGGRFRALRSEAAAQAFDAVRPRLTAALLAAPDPLAATSRMAAILERLPTAINTFRLLQARPALFQLLTDILALAPPLADRLGRRPELLDALIDRSAFDLPGTAAELAARMRRAARGNSYEARLDAIRIVTGEVRFALGVQVIEGANDPLAIGAALARLAEAGLQVAYEAATEQFAAAHGRIAGGELVVLALGRLGGELLTHASDLDLVYLFTGTIDAESDGGRPLGATLYFNRLAPRVSAALSVPTAEGALYEVDTRLRPQGYKGPLATSLDGFTRYQLEEAWTWEHMALTRARVVAGSPAARGAVREVIGQVLRRKRDPVTLRADILSMRADMAAHKPPAGPLDAKLLRGGLVDLEFMAHYLQLRAGNWFDPVLDRALRKLSQRELLAPEVRLAHAFLNRLLIAARLLAPDLKEPHPAAAKVLARSCGLEDYRTLLGQITAVRTLVASEWQRVFEEELEVT
ncbi:glutamine-synthetase adenylyltransferase [Porphyrobacter sp. GA68]|uniref:[protein-PII] uridylyltransferase family protein n=1 Tax=Porphyrobacter sp. GA68 TaxID=2883480 RepID=UPI001D18338B|nr:glutamine-synthetase adenylyltransferase [Porphyrobacter sp. GA68]